MKVSITGAAGRMGKRIVCLSHEHKEVEVAGAVEAPGHPAVGTDVGECAGIGNIGVPIVDDVRTALNECDVLIDFSTPKSSVSNVLESAKLNKAIVVGTTGFNTDQKTQVLQVGSSTRCLVAPNMSMGVNLLFTLVEKAAEALGDAYHVEIVEAHHALKKDAPSGTANKLAQVVADALHRDLESAAVYGREGIVGERKPEEIGVFAVRGGDIVGEHQVMFVTNGERLELTHRAHSRDAFARGAVQAALWLVSQPEGLYDMQDVLGFKAGK